ncbi:hypothetical protein HGRIS_014752 [Hohenbuehelia grisea]|uniref:Proline dehydrogenase n=1 Tax=Hohenbuehelia grisea TaxID=104357 RepID=A0ABR3IQN2_9AGAR
MQDPPQEIRAAGELNGLMLSLISSPLSTTTSHPQLHAYSSHGRQLLLATVRRPINGTPKSGRFFGTSSRPNGYRALRSGSAVAATVGALMAAGVYDDADASGVADGQAPVPETSQSIGALIRAYFVYAMCSIPALVDASPKILEVSMAVPGLKQVTEAVVRATFFEQFVGGDTAEGTLPLLVRLRAANKGALFAYSVEVDEAEASGGAKLEKAGVHKQIVEEMLHCIDVAADFEDDIARAKGYSLGRKTWVAVKMTALLPDAQSLINLSSYIINHRPPPRVPIPFPGCPETTDLSVLHKSTEQASIGTLSSADITALRDLHDDLVRICARARDRGVRIIIDAEYSWYQPAIDALTLALMREFNKLPESNRKASTATPVQPLVYGTFQAYLRRTPAHLEQAIQDAKRHHYALGAKLVRGAYHPHEVAAFSASASNAHSLSISPDDHPPVWERKEDTDACYNTCVKMLIDAVAADLGGGHAVVPDKVDVVPVSPEQARSWISSAAAWRPVWPASWSWPGAETSRTVVQLDDADTSSLAATRRAPRTLPTIGVLFGTHNWASCRLIFDELVSRGLAVREGATPIDESGDYIVRVGEDVTERVTIGQLYGMSNALTDHLVARTRSASPLIIKYVPYGALSEVMPYLSRRAIENKSVLGDGGAADERRRAGSEIWKRLFGS